MFQKLKDFFFGKPALVAEPEKVAPVVEAPVVEEKVETKVNPVALALDVDPVVLPQKKSRKPRAAKADKPVAKKAAPKKTAAMTSKKSRSKKV